MLEAKQKEQVQGLGMYPYIEAPYQGAPSVWTTDISTVKAKLNVNTWGLRLFYSTGSVLRYLCVLRYL